MEEIVGLGFSLKIEQLNKVPTKTTRSYMKCFMSLNTMERGGHVQGTCLELSQ
jgi:hypothetical protein